MYEAARSSALELHPQLTCKLSFSLAMHAAQVMTVYRLNVRLYEAQGSMQQYMPTIDIANKRCPNQ